MDTSKATKLMQEVSNQLHPHIDNLPFRRLREQLSDFSLIHGKRNKKTYIFRFGRTMSPLSVTYEDRVKAIPFIQEIHQGAGEAVIGYELSQILFFRERAGGGCLVWYLHSASFTLAPISNTYFDSTKSVINPIFWPVDMAEIDLPNNFEKKIREGIGSWIKETIAARTLTLAKLEELQLKFPSSGKI